MNPNPTIAAAGTTIAIEIVEEIHKQLKERKIYEKFFDLVSRRARFPILILGASGAGKSSLLRDLREMDPYISRHDRSAGVEKVSGTINDYLFDFYNTPGQVLHASKRSNAIKEAAAMTSLGIINVCPYGYHEGAIPADGAAVGDKPILEYLAKCRNVEIDMISEWANILCGDGGAARWVITVVTKADLWWNNTEEQEGLAHYLRGEYSKALESYLTVSHKIRPFSSLNQPFFDRVPMSGWYSDRLRIEHRKDLLVAILENVCGT